MLSRIIEKGLKTRHTWMKFHHSGNEHKYYKNSQQEEESGY